MGYQTLPTVPAYDKQAFIQRVTVDEAVEFFILSDRLVAKEVHWGPGRTAGHWTPREDCVGCAHQWPLKVLCYLSIMHIPLGEIEILELPHESSLRMETIIGANRGLRGLHLRAWRKGGKRGTVLFELRTPFEAYSQAGQRKLPEPMDIDSALAHIWQLNLKKLKLAHPFALPHYGENV